jgi:CheY-like chemotaxis protein
VGQTLSQPAAGADGRPTAQLPPARVPVVEDGVSNQKLISRILGRAGVTVDLASDGRAGVDMALAREGAAPYDVILMDMQAEEPILSAANE